MNFSLVSWARGLFVGGVVLSIVFFLPMVWVPTGLLKITLFAVCVGLAAVLYVLGGGVKELWRAHGCMPMLALFLLPLFYGVSLFYSMDRSVGLMGFGVETDTLAFTLMAALGGLLAFGLFRTQARLRTLEKVLWWSLIAALLFQVVVILMGPALPGGFFADRSVNAIGKWNDFGIAMVVLVALVLARLELQPGAPLFKIGGGLVLVATLGLLGFVNFTLAWALALVVALCVGGAALLLRKRAEEGELQGAPWFAGATVLVSILFLFFGPAVNSYITSVIPVTSLEVRPSYGGTYDVLAQERAGSLPRLAIGNGPNTFGYSWLKYKPTEVNQTPFWNLDFVVGYSTIAVALGTVGLLGVIGWLMPILLSGIGFLRAWRQAVLGSKDVALTVGLGLSLVVLFMALVWYVPSQNLGLVTFVLSGALFGFLWRQGRVAPQEARALSPVHKGLVIVVGLLLVVVAGGVALFVSKRAVAETLAGRAVVYAQEGDYKTALAYAGSALKVEEAPDVLRAAFEARVAELNALNSNTSAQTSELEEQFTAAVRDSLQLAQKAISATPNDYRPHFMLARLYHSLGGLNVQGALESASSSYRNAAERNPKSPVIPLFQAQLAALSKDDVLAEAHVTRALTLKPNYTDAILFAAQLYIARGDLPSAIAAAQAAVQSAPGVPSIWFELGVLHYVGGDSQNAIAPLERALELAPDYANAKYFLGLAYYKQGRASQGIALFEQLALQNPTNTDVAALLQTMRNGKPLPQNNNTTPLQQ